MQNLTSLTQSSSGNITCAKNFSVTGNLAITGTTAFTGGMTADGDFTPVTNDTAALGTTSLRWSDLHLASGAVINFDAGDVTLTHSANALAFAGGCLNMFTSGSPYAYTAGTPAFTLYATNAGTSGSTSAEPFYVKSTLTGAGQVGGRSRFHCYSNVASGGWVNALKAYMEFGASGSASGLGSAFCAELALSAGTAAAAYCAVEAELVLGSGAATGQQTSFLYCNVSGDGKATFDTNGYFLHVGDGITAAAGKFCSADYQSLKCFFTDSSTTRYLVLSNAENCLGLNVTALNATAGRIADLHGSIANGNLGDGYGAVEVDMTMTGTAAGHNAATSSWVNIPSGTVGAGNYVCAMNNGVYEDSAATITNAKVIFGMRCQKILGDTDALSFPLSVNTNNTAITALIDVNNTTDLGWTTGAGSADGGKIPFCRDANGTILYVNTYTS